MQKRGGGCVPFVRGEPEFPSIMALCVYRWGWVCCVPPVVAHIHSINRPIAKCTEVLYRQKPLSLYGLIISMECKGKYFALVRLKGKASRGGANHPRDGCAAVGGAVSGGKRAEYAC